MRKIIGYFIALTFLLVSLNFATPAKAIVTPVGVSYQGYIQTGFQPLVPDGKIAGTVGKNIRLEGMKINLTNAPAGGAIKYMVHIMGGTWQPWKFNGAFAGTAGKALAVDAFRVTLDNMPGYSVEYVAYMRNVGWLPWIADGVQAGWVNKGVPMDAFAVRIVKISDNTTYSVNYMSHIKNLGWQLPVSNGQISGTSGIGQRIDAYKVNIVNAPIGGRIKYESHVYKVGWTAPVYNGAQSGTFTNVLAFDAIRLSLENMPGTSVQYRVRINKGYWLPWVADGATAGTTLGLYQIEALEIRIILKNPVTPAAPAVTNNDTLDTVTGMTTAMEYSLDSSPYVLYNATTFGALNLRGNHTLLVRVAAAGINPVSADTTLTFTASTVDLAEVAVTAYETAPIRSLIEITVADALKIYADTVVSLVSDVPIRTAFENRILLKTSTINDAKAEIAVAAYETAPITTLIEIAAAEALKSPADAAVALVVDATQRTAFELRIANKAAAIFVAKAEFAVAAYETAPITTIDQVATAEGLKVPADIAVALVSDATLRTALENRILIKTASINEAKAVFSVVNAETTPTQDNVNTAQGLVTALPDGAVKTALQSRIAAVQAILDATIVANNAIAALESVNWAVANQAAVTQGIADSEAARLLVDGALITTRAGFNTRLDVVDALLSARQVELLLIPSTIVFADGSAVAKLTTDANFINAVSGVGTGTITYTSGTPATATINATTGEVTIVGVGTTVITAVKASTSTHLTVTNTYTLTVTAPLIPSTIVFADAAPVKGIDIVSYKNAVSGVGTGAITYTSSTPSTATVNATTGVITMVGVGTTEITAVKAATATHTAVTNSYTLTVFIPVTVTLNKNTTSMLIGNTDLLIATVLPADAIDKSVVWSVAGSSTVVTVVNGLVTGARLGIATVVVTTVDGRTAQCFVTVADEASILNNFNLGRSMTYMPGLITQFGDAIGMNLPDYKRMTLDQQYQVQQIMINAPGFATIADIRNTFDEAVTLTVLNEINYATIDTIGSAITNNASALGLDLDAYNALSPEKQVIVQGYLILPPYFGNSYMSFAEVQTSFSLAVSSASAAETALAEINAATDDTIENALTSNAELLWLNVDNYILYGSKDSLNLVLVDLVFTNPYDLQVAIDTVVMVPVNEINMATMDTIATVITDNATALGLDLDLYNDLSPEQQVIVQGYLVFTPYFVNWYISIAEVQTAFNSAVSNAPAAEAALAEINAATSDTIENALTSNAALLGLFLDSYDPLTMNEGLAAQDFANTFDLQMAIYGW